MENKLYTLIVHSENFAGLLSQVTAVFTRLQINIESLNVSASSIEGVHKYTITACTDRNNIEKVVKQVEKKIEVLQAQFFTDDEIYSHEIALYKVSMSEFESQSEASKVVRQYNAHIVEVNPVFAIVEKNGSSEDISALYRELSALNCVLQFVRSGRVTIPKSCIEPVSQYLNDRAKEHTNKKKK
ncbi:MAG: acetolactate synthase small subunit [Bacteroidaceae bacterium]|nr:acetolactate synthase small subunit [Bacteroidaceae bacterium]